jgi:hypothetical protein
MLVALTDFVPLTFNEILHEGKAGQSAGLFFSYHHPELPTANDGDNLYPKAYGISIYKA